MGTVIRIRQVRLLLATVIGAVSMAAIGTLAQNSESSQPQTQSEYQPQPQFKQKRSREEIEARIRELEQQKRKVELFIREHPNRIICDLREADLENVIAKYERRLEQCAVKKSNRCADVMYVLVSLYCDKAREEHAANPGGNAPDNSKAIDMYQQLIQEYPLFEKIPYAKKMLDALLQLQNK